MSSFLEHNGWPDLCYSWRKKMAMMVGEKWSFLPQNSLRTNFWSSLLSILSYSGSRDWVKPIENAPQVLSSTLNQEHCLIPLGSHCLIHSPLLMKLQQLLLNEDSGLCWLPFLLFLPKLLWKEFALLCFVDRNFLGNIDFPW